MVIPIAHAPIPTDVSNLIRESASIHATDTEYFDTVHLWWSIISKHSSYSQIVNPLISRRDDVALLLLCIKLVVWRSLAHDLDSRKGLYLAAKRYCIELEPHGTFDIRALQATILITLYEFGPPFIHPSYLPSHLVPATEERSGLI